MNLIMFSLGCGASSAAAQNVECSFKDQLVLRGVCGRCVSLCVCLLKLQPEVELDEDVTSGECQLHSRRGSVVRGSLAIEKQLDAEHKLWPPTLDQQADQRLFFIQFRFVSVVEEIIALIDAPNQFSLKTLTNLLDRLRSTLLSILSLANTFFDSQSSFLLHSASPTLLDVHTFCAFEAVVELGPWLGLDFAQWPLLCSWFYTVRDRLSIPWQEGAYLSVLDRYLNINHLNITLTIGQAPGDSVLPIVVEKWLRLPCQQENGDESIMIVDGRTARGTASILRLLLSFRLCRRELAEAEQWVNALRFNLVALLQTRLKETTLKFFDGFARNCMNQAEVVRLYFQAIVKDSAFLQTGLEDS